MLLDGAPVGYDRAALNDLRRRVGLVFQDPDNQLFAASVRQDISFGPINLGLSEDEVRARVEQAIRDTQIEDLAERPTHLLSYGQKKRVAIAGVLAMAPEVIVADEPTAGLDPESTARLLGLLDGLHASGRTMVVSTHDVEMALAWADHALVMRRGSCWGPGRRRLFADADLVREARLVTPIVLEVYQRLLRGGVPLPPATPAAHRGAVAELVSATRRSGGARCARERGTWGRGGAAGPEWDGPLTRPGGGTLASLRLPPGDGRGGTGRWRQDERRGRRRSGGPGGAPGSAWGTPATPTCWDGSGCPRAIPGSRPSGPGTRPPRPWGWPAPWPPKGARGASRSRPSRTSTR